MKSVDVIERILANVRLLPVNPDGPDADAVPPLPMVNHEITPEFRKGFPDGTLIMRYTLGECSVIVTQNRGKLWHLSIAHPSRYPTWDEISQARYRILPPNIWTAMYLPPKADFVNVHRNCFQLMQAEPPAEELR